MPVYPQVIGPNGRTYFETLDPNVLIESIANAGLLTQEIVYVNFGEQKRWKQTGLPNNNGLDVIGTNYIAAGKVTRIQGKQLGQAQSVMDNELATRLDIPSLPGWLADAEETSQALGLGPSQEVLTFEWLPWVP